MTREQTAGLVFLVLLAGFVLREVTGQFTGGTFAEIGPGVSEGAAMAKVRAVTAEEARRARADGHVVKLVDEGDTPHAVTRGQAITTALNGGTAGGPIAASLGRVSISALSEFSPRYRKHLVWVVVLPDFDPNAARSPAGVPLEPAGADPPAGRYDTLGTWMVYVDADSGVELRQSRCDGCGYSKVRVGPAQPPPGHFGPGATTPER